MAQVNGLRKTRVERTPNRRGWRPAAASFVVCPLIAWIGWLTTENRSPLDEKFDRNSQRLQLMNSNDMLSLKRKLKRFERLPPERQAALREFHQQLDAHQHRDSLKLVLERYYEWLSGLDSRLQADLTDTMDLQKRMDTIRDIRREQWREFSFLPKSDFEAFDAWLLTVSQAKRNEALQLLGTVSRSGRRELDLNENSPPERLFRFLLRTPAFQSRLVSEEDIGKLQGSVSESTAQLLADPAIAQNVIVHFVRNQYIEPEELQRFYIHELPTRLRDELDKLPHDQMTAQLRRMYQLKQIGFPVDQWTRRMIPDRRPGN